MARMTGFDRVGIARARLRGKQARLNDAILLTYLPDPGRIHLKLRNRAEVTIPLSSIPTLRNIKEEDLRRMRLSTIGDVIELPDYDQHISVAGVVRTAVFGEDPFSRAGSVRSRAKSVAARANGKKGGRPKHSERTVA